MKLLFAVKHSGQTLIAGRIALKNCAQELHAQAAKTAINETLDTDNSTVAKMIFRTSYNMRCQGIVPLITMLMLCIMLSSCILGRSDRTSKDDSGSGDNTGNPTPGNETENERSTYKSLGLTAWDILAEDDINLFSFYIIDVDQSAIDDSIKAESLRFQQPALPDYDKDNKDGNKFLNGKLTVREWIEGESSWGWSADETVVNVGSDQPRDYYLLDIDESDTEQKGWTLIEDNDLVRFRMVDDAIQEDHLGLNYEWIFSRDLGSDGDLNSTDDLDDNLTQIAWDSEENFGRDNPHPDDWLNWFADSAVTTEHFASGDRKFLVVKGVTQTVYVIEQIKTVVGGDQDVFEFVPIDSSITDIASLYLSYSAASTRFAQIPDFNLRVQFSGLTALVYRSDSDVARVANLVTLTDDAAQPLGGETVVLLEMNPLDKRYLGIPYETDIIIASPNTAEDQRLYFGKRYLATSEAELDTTIEEVQSSLGWSLTCLSDITNLIAQGASRELLDTLAGYCPKQHIFFNNSALAKIEQSLREWRDEDHREYDD